MWFTLQATWSLMLALGPAVVVQKQPQKYMTHAHSWVPMKLHL